MRNQRLRAPEGDDVCESTRRLSILSKRRGLAEYRMTDNSRLSGLLRSRSNQFPTLHLERQSSGAHICMTSIPDGATNGRRHRMSEARLAGTSFINSGVGRF